MNFFKKPTLEFICHAPGIHKIMPIIPTKDLEHQWIKNARREFISEMKNNPEKFELYTNICRCPGIKNILSEGWVVRLYQDVTIETFGDGSYFEWKSAVDQTIFNEYHKFSIEQNIVQYHHETQFFAHRKNWPADTLKTILKFVLPWSVRIPKGYDLIQIPVAYLDENRFTAVPGIADNIFGIHPINVQMYWHVLNKKVLLKAGTPLAQFILKKKESVPWKIIETGSNPEVIRELIERHILKNTRFVTNYNEVKKIFSKGKQ